MGVQQYDENSGLIVQYGFAAADGTGLVQLLSNLQVAARADQITAINGDSIDHHAQVVLTSGGTPFALGSVTVPAGAGYLGVPNVDLLTPLLRSPQVGVVIPYDMDLGVQLEEAVTGSNVVAVTVLGGWL
jgi:hypothetical protein